MRGLAGQIGCMTSYAIQQDVRIFQKGFVPEPEDGEPGPRQPRIALRIFALAKGVDPTVELDRQPQLRAIEIDRDAGQ